MNKARTITVTSDKFESNRLVFLLLSAIAVIACFVLLQRSVLAQESTGSGKIQITYPISTLGNCASQQECKEYCNDETHKEACMAFAKSKGFYKVPSGTGNARNRLVLERAKTELGCSSEQTCKEICSQEANKQKCEEFAKKFNLIQKKELSSSVLEKAKSTLGCNSEESCKVLCQNASNRDKCATFAKQNNLGGGTVRIATGSAKNAQGFEQVRKTLEDCVKNAEKCKKDFERIEKEIVEKSDEFCKANPKKCREFINKEIKSGSVSASLEEYRGNKTTPSGEGVRMPGQVGQNTTEIVGTAQSGMNSGDVQGISRVPSFFDWLFNVFLK